MNRKEMEMYKSIQELLSNNVEEYHKAIDDVIMKAKKQPVDQPFYASKEFLDSINYIPYYLPSVILQKAGHIEEFQTELLKTLSLKCPIDCTVSEFVNMSIFPTENRYADFYNKVYIEESSWSEFWEELFKLCCASETNAFEPIKNALALILVCFQSPLGDVFKNANNIMSLPVIKLAYIPFATNMVKRIDELQQD